MSESHTRAEEIRQHINLELVPAIEPRSLTKVESRVRSLLELRHNRLRRNSVLVQVSSLESDSQEAKLVKERQNIKKVDSTFIKSPGEHLQQWRDS